VNVLAFFAHPDDETMLAGGTLALLAEQGASISILIATRGEGGEMGEPPLCDRERLGVMREAELRCAVQALGASRLLLMDYHDPLVGPDNQLFPFTDDKQTLIAELVAAIQATQADVLLAHGRNGEYGHPAHKLVHQTAWQAVQSLGQAAPLFYSVQGQFEGHPFPLLANVDVPAHLILDVTPILEQKTAAALCHRTQHNLFVRRRSEEAGRPLTVPEIIMSLESVSRVWPPVENTIPDDAFASLLLNSGQARPAI
jgi:LmbE family N-acetylglucosaminyl deacetylase